MHVVVMFYCRVIEAAKLIFPGRVNVDMIFGRPKQSCASWIDELNKVNN